MFAEQFNWVLDETINRIKVVLESKADEYAVGKDRLHNFKQAAKTRKTTPIKALSGMMVKHTTSVYDMMEDDDSIRFSLAQWDEKIIDHLNYLVLLRALVIERLEDEDKKKIKAVGSLPPLPGMTQTKN